MILGIGVDIVDLIRFDNLAVNQKFRDQYFSDSENLLNAQSLAGRFAAREALYKAVGTQDTFEWKDIEIINTSSGAPKFIFKNNAAKYFELKRIHLSISHVPEYAISIVIIESV